MDHGDTHCARYFSYRYNDRLVGSWDKVLLAFYVPIYVRRLAWIGSINRACHWRTQSIIFHVANTFRFLRAVDALCKMKKTAKKHESSLLSNKSTFFIIIVLSIATWFVNTSVQLLIGFQRRFCDQINDKFDNFTFLTWPFFILLLNFPLCEFAFCRWI